MKLFDRRKAFDRSACLRAASDAKAKGRHKKALGLYQQVLKADPSNTSLCREIAPLLVKAKKMDEAWMSFRIAAEGFAKQGFIEKAIGIYREATHYLPRQSAAWIAVANLQVQRGSPEDAAAVLLEGSRHFRSRAQREEALRLLTLAHKASPTNFKAGFELARLRSKMGDRKGAWNLLRELQRFAIRRERRRIRSAQFWLAPGPTTAMRWLRVLFTGG